VGRREAPGVSRVDMYPKIPLGEPQRVRWLLMSKQAIRAPRPGRAVRGSPTGRPVMALLDLLGRRWALRILWELREEGTPTFRDLQARCGNVSSSVLNQRLHELRAAGILTTEDRAGYQLTDEGRHLLAALAPLDSWATRWAKRTTK
jgi:DNA-binding HxlR family transcriptional regulator